MRTRSNRRRLGVGARAAPLAALAVLLSACGTAVPSEDELTQAFEVSGFSEEVSACASAALRDNLSDNELVLLMERGGGGAPEDDPDDEDDSADRVREALLDCRAPTSPISTVPIGGPDTPTSPAGSTPSSAPDPAPSEASDP